MQGINIYSGEHGLGGALTNPTKLSFEKGNIVQQYPICYHNRNFDDVETAYQLLKGETDDSDMLMTELIATKLLQHPRLFETIKNRGGVSWLEHCSHETNAKSSRFQAWEGCGRESRFVRNLIAGFELALTGHGTRQLSLF